MKATFDDVTELVAYFHMSHLVKKRNDPIWWLGNTLVTPLHVRHSSLTLMWSN